MESDEERERSRNNNATMLPPTNRRSLEEGECDDSNPGPSAKRSRDDGSAAKASDDLRSYVDQKFSALARMVELERELSDKNRELDLLKAKGRQYERSEVAPDTQSELTIYHNAVIRSNRGSSSSEELIDTSNEMAEDTGLAEPVPNESASRFTQRRDFAQEYDNNETDYIAEREMERAKELNRDRRRSHYEDDRNRDRNREPRPETSRFREDRHTDDRDDSYRLPLPPRRDVVADKTKRIVNEAEAAKARIYEVPGREYYDDSYDNRNRDIYETRSNLSTVQMDENYKLVAAHVDSKLRTQVINHEYVDFSKLLPRSRLGSQPSDQQHQFLQIVNLDGAAGFMTMNDKNLAISSYSRWEQAFRVFSDIYSAAFPDRATELIQYNHIIHTAAQSYLWDNVYTYDIEFRKHMQVHPTRN